jgi:hypothetical protein
MSETLLSPSNILLFGREVKDLAILHPHDHNPFVDNRKTANNLLSAQIKHGEGDDDVKSRFARIYSFSYEGTYFDLPRPMLFLVHGEGKLVTRPPPAAAANPHQSRAPAQPSVSGVAAADFEFADGLMVWSYDKADYTIRMDVETGMFEQVLLDACFGDGWDGPFVSGGRVSGGRVAGGRVSGGRVAGGRVSGGRVSGGRVGGGGPSD